MRKMILITVFLTFACRIHAQSVAAELRSNAQLSAGNFMAYSQSSNCVLTPAPAGKRAFYISHYGRHGSCYHSKMRNYDLPWQVMSTADSLHMLTPLGKEVLQQIVQMRQEAQHRWGELTPLGIQQQRDIVHRMVDRFPEVFAGEAHIDAKSTVIGRSILSMENALLQLLSMNPNLRITHDASYYYMDYLDQTDKTLTTHRQDSLARNAFRQYVDRHNGDTLFLRRLFNNQDYIHRIDELDDFRDLLFKLASNQQNTLLGNAPPLYRIYTDEEIRQSWLRDNAWWYTNYGAYQINGGLQPYTQRNLLRKIIEDADSCLRLEKPGVQLRYGHDVDIMPLVCLLDMNGYGLSIYHLEELESKGWINYRVIPMAANIQMVFYRQDAADTDVLFKVLLNEREATLPLPDERKPYYRWSDFKKYYLNKLEQYAKS